MAFVLYSTLIACSVAGLWLRGGAGWRIRPSTAANINTRRTIPGIARPNMHKSKWEKRYLILRLHLGQCMTSILALAEPRFNPYT